MMRSLLLSVFAAATLVVGSAVAQNASVTYYGTSCTYNSLKSPRIVIHPNYMPQLGGTLGILYFGANGGTSILETQPVLITGLQRLDIALPKGPPIPGEILQSQPTGCRLYVTPDLITAMRFDGSTGGYESYLLLPVPNNPGLIGFTFFCQWAAFHRINWGTDLVAVTFSDRAEITVGN